MSQEPDWIDRSGKGWMLSEMTDSHLQNTERFLRRQAADAFGSSLAAASMCFQGEQASYEADRASDHLSDVAHDMTLKADEMKAEIERRAALLLFA